MNEKLLRALWLLSDVLLVQRQRTYCKTLEETRENGRKIDEAIALADKCLSELSEEDLYNLHQRVDSFGNVRVIEHLVAKQIRLKSEKA